MKRMRFLDLVHRGLSLLELNHHGRYSVDRFVALVFYQQQTSVGKIGLAIVLTPLPALISLILLDIPPLAPPDAGWNQNSCFWIRAFMTGVLIHGTVLLQLRCLLPQLPITSRQILGITVFVSACAIGFVMGLASRIGFPLPFTITMAGPVTSTCFSIAAYIAWGDQLKQDTILRIKFFRFALFMAMQLVLIIVYPVLAFVFNTTNAIGQTLLACVLPFIKLLLKTWLSKYLTNHPDLQPQFLVFNVEVFHVMFVACCMQNARSPYTTVLIMTLDALHIWHNLRTVITRIKKLAQILNCSTNASAPIVVTAHLDIVACTMHLLRDLDVLRAVDAVGAEKVMYPRDKGRLITQVRIAPLEYIQTQAATPPIVSLVAKWSSSLNSTMITRLDALSPLEKVAFAQDALGLLHLTEHVVLAEYIEVIVPVVYVLYLTTVFQLPNRQFYPQLRNMTTSAHTKAITSVLVYASLELVSFVFLDLQLRRTLRFHPLRQLTFVLDHHWWLLPAKLMLWVTVVIQCTLEHFGADYSFQFQWLRHQSP